MSWKEQLGPVKPWLCIGVFVVGILVAFAAVPASPVIVGSCFVTLAVPAAI